MTTHFSRRPFLAASVFGIRRANGERGLALDPGQRFLLSLDNRTSEDAFIRQCWQTPPHRQDGVFDAGNSGRWPLHRYNLIAYGDRHDDGGGL